MVFTDERLIQRWDLKTFAKEATAHCQSIGMFARR